MKIIFLRRDRSIFGTLIRWWTLSPYSHCELLFSDGSTFSAQPGVGTRFWRVPAAEQGSWDVLEYDVLPTEEAHIRVLCLEEKGRSYDWFGIIWSQVFFLRREHPDRWFCSEVCAAFLKSVRANTFGEACSYNPGSLFTRLLAVGARRATF